MRNKRSIVIALCTIIAFILVWRFSRDDTDNSSQNNNQSVVSDESKQRGNENSSDDNIDSSSENSEDNNYDSGDSLSKQTYTNIASKDGDWSDPTTWSGGLVPRYGATVHIPEGVEIIFDANDTGHLQSLNVDGKFSFATDKDTKLLVDNVFVSSTGTFEVGSSSNPI